MLTDAEERFVSWLVTQKNARGTYYLERVACKYVRYLRTSPRKLDMSLPINERDVFQCNTIERFDILCSAFTSASNYKEINSIGHQTFSAGLSAFRRYLQSMENNGNFEKTVKIMSKNVSEETAFAETEELRLVDFAHPELCSGCDPITCIVEGKDFSGGNWRDLLVSITEYFLNSKTEMEELYGTSLYKRGDVEFLLKDKPNPRLSPRKLSNGYWINVNLSIKDLVSTIGRLCEFCNVNLNDVKITYVTKQDAKSAQLKSNFQIFLTDNDETDSNGAGPKSAVISEPSIPDEVIEVLNRNYASGFRFEATYVNLLSNASGIDIDENIQYMLKSKMFCREDDVYFLFDMIADSPTRKDIIDSAEDFLKEYGCFEISEIYNMYREKLNPVSIRNAIDFENFYEQIGQKGVRCVQAPGMSNRIARYSNDSVGNLFKVVSDKIVSYVTEEYYGSCDEDDLHTKFSAFSTDLLCRIIRQYAADKLVRAKINESICYQTFNALGLSENFSEQLSEVLEKMNDVGLEPTQEALHTALSLKMGINFKEEYGLPDWDTYRRLIAVFYKSDPPREWKNNIFAEVKV